MDSARAAAAPKRPLLAHGHAHASAHAYDQDDDPADDEVVDVGTPNVPPSPTSTAFLLAIFSALSGFLYGYDTSVIGGALLHIKGDLSLSILQQEAVVSGVLAGAAVGALAGGLLCDRIGRQNTLLFSAVIVTLGAFSLAMAHSFSALMSGRVLEGLGLGIGFVCAPIYIAEAAHHKHRGRLVTFLVLLVAVGNFVGYLMHTAMAKLPGAWRWMLGVSALPAILQIIGISFMPESPRYLFRAGRPRQAQEVLLRLSDASHDSSSREIEVIQYADQREKSLRLTDLFCSPLLYPLIVVVGLLVFQQLAGIHAVMYYMPTIFKMAAFRSTETALLLSNAVAVADVALTLVGMFLIDRVGRRRLLLVSVAGVVLGLVALGFAFAHLTGLSPAEASCTAYKDCGPCMFDRSCGWCASTNMCYSGDWRGPFSVLDSTPICPDWRFEIGCGPVTDHGVYLALLAFLIYVSCFALGFGPVPWTVMAESFPTPLRASGAAVAGFAYWTANFVMSCTFLSLTHVISHAGTFWMYGGLASLAWLFAYKTLPETSNRRLEAVVSEYRTNFYNLS